MTFVAVEFCESSEIYENSIFTGLQMEHRILPQSKVKVTSQIYKPLLGTLCVNVLLE